MRTLWPLLFFIGLLPPTGSAAGTSIYKVIDRYLEKGYFDSSFDQLIWNASVDFLDNTAYKGKLIINDHPDENYLNIYVLDRDPNDYFYSTTCNCAYYQDGNVIICDKKLLLFFFDLLNSDDWGFLNSNFQFFLIQWIIGHEIGHMLSDHQVGNFNFNDEGSPITHSASNYFSKNSELEADLSMINGLKKEDQENIFWAWMGLNNLISNMYPEQTLGAWMEQDTTKIELSYNPKYHPPWLYRFLTMSFALNKKYELDGSGYYEYLENRLSLVEDQNEPLPIICAEADANARELPPTESPPLNDSISGQIDASLKLSNAYRYFSAAQYESVRRTTTELINHFNANPQELRQQNDLSVFFHAYYLRGLTQLIRRDYSKAADDFKYAARISPNDAGPYIKLGVIKTQEDSLQSAKRYFQWAIDADPGNTEAWLGLGLVKYQQADTFGFKEAMFSARLIDATLLNKQKVRYEKFWPIEVLHLFERAQTEIHFELTSFENPDTLYKKLYVTAYRIYRSEQFDLSIKLVNHITENQMKFRQEHGGYPDSLFTAKCTELLGLNYLALGNSDLAKMYLTNNLNFRKELLARDSSNTNLFFLGKAHLYDGIFLEKDQKDSVGAVERFQQAVTQFNKVDFAKDPVLLMSTHQAYFRAAGILADKGRVDEGLDLLRGLLSRYQNLVAVEPYLVEGLFEVTAPYLVHLKAALDQSKDEKYRTEFDNLIHSLLSILNAERFDFNPDFKAAAFNQLKIWKEYFEDPITGYLQEAQLLVDQTAGQTTHNRDKIDLLQRAKSLYHKSLDNCKDERSISIIAELMEIYENLLELSETVEAKTALLEEIILFVLPLELDEEYTGWQKKVISHSYATLSREQILSGQYQKAENTAALGLETAASEYRREITAHLFMAYFLNRKLDLAKKLVDAQEHDSEERGAFLSFLLEKLDDFSWQYDFENTDLNQFVNGLKEKP